MEIILHCYYFLPREWVKGELIVSKLREFVLKMHSGLQEMNNSQR